MSRVLLLTLLLANAGVAAEPPFLAYVTAKPSPTMIAYTPAGLDPRSPNNHVTHRTSELRADLVALRPAFDGLVLYGYHEASTPRIVDLAHELGYRAVLLGIWQPKSTAEVDGVVDLAKRYRDRMAIAIVVGNEGVAFDRYETEDVRRAAARIRESLDESIPLTTSEPEAEYEKPFFREFGDFLAPNIHPYFHAEDLDAPAAAAWARARAIVLARRSGKPVLLKETGFPHAGTPRHTTITQKAFWTAFTKPGLLAPATDDHPWVYLGVAFEAYDLPWKAEASGLPVERSWGLLSARREPYPALDVWRELAPKPDRRPQP